MEKLKAARVEWQEGAVAFQTRGLRKIKIERISAFLGETSVVVEQEVNK